MEECITDIELSADILCILYLKEDQLMPFKGQSPQIHLRRYLVDWLAILCERFEIGRHALHLAVYMLDRFMDHYAIVKESQLQLLALACLLIASKFKTLVACIAGWFNFSRWSQKGGERGLRECLYCFRRWG